MILTFDTFLLEWIQEVLQNETLDILFPFITMLGNKGMLWIMIALFLFCFKQYRKLALTMILSLILGLLLGNLILKPLVGRIRPFQANRFFNLLIPPPKDFSFPSGHTLSSFAAASVLLTEEKRMGIPAMIVAGLIAFSRLYLYVHYPSDVIAGIILGVLCGFAAKKIMKFFKS
ncbi:MAG: phosphatase PAP2 family protein [Ruminococcaceae bacterium]|nr:phosphatase PAP2 family protein [Oscillospiraceae bacterium]